MRILVVKFSGLRGALATTAAFRSLKERHPSARVTFVTSPGSEAGLEGCPVVGEVVAFDPQASAWEAWALLNHLRRQRFDAAVALGVDPLSRRLVAWSRATKRACAGQPSWALFPWFHQVVTGSVADPHEASRDHAVMAAVFGLAHEVPGLWYAASRMEEHGFLVEPRRYAVLHPGASRADQVFELDKWAKVGRELLAARRVERIMAEALCGLIGPAAQATRGGLGMPQLAKLISEARLFLGADSPILQLAAAVNTPVVGVFGPSDYIRSRPWGVLHRIVRVDTTPFEGEASEDYRRRMDRALARITADQVVRAAEEVLQLSAP
ncbi:MAG: glycosyltransferase family 9 protein [Verrucomicrobia bacterium]|nr:glycosyltransferase family 9 protein [Verrucomicrobiota bacterium]